MSSPFALVPQEATEGNRLLLGMQLEVVPDFVLVFCRATSGVQPFRRVARAWAINGERTTDASIV